LEDFASRFLPELGLPRLHYHPGWDVERSLAQLLAEQRRQDIHHGYTRLGPHRADWRVGFERIPNRDFLSRGQVKLVALACILAQASLFAERAGEWPIVCLDDPGSELDRQHQRAVFEELSKHAMQAWITTTRNAQLPRQTEAAVFHVERQAVRQVGPRLRVV
jgi:DNA replication and repair protein RecF